MSEDLGSDLTNVYTIDKSKIKNPIKEEVLDSNSDLEANSISLSDDENFKAFDGKTEGTRLKRDLKARHTSMIALGGSLGTGLLIGTGTSLGTAGPVSMLISYSFVGILVFFVMSCLGEMASYIPLDGFTSYATRYCDPALGFAVGYSYLFKYFILPPNQLTAAALVMQYWVDRDTVNPGVWITILLIIIIIINSFGVKFFGEFEFWLSSFKVLVMLGLIILMFVIMLGGGPSHDRLGFRYWKNPGAFKEYSDAISGDTGKFVSFSACFVYALFCYLGIELTGIVAAEAENPRKNIPKAVKLTMCRLIIFYVISIFLLGMCVASNDPRLASAKNASTSAAASPFVVAIINSGINVLPHIFNACVLIFVFSACNSDLYVASRSLYSLAIDNKAPKFLAITNRWGIPYYSLGVSVLFCLLAFMSVSSGSAKVFNYFVNVVSIFGVLSWICILITYICFDRAVRAQGVDKSTFAYVAPFQPYGAWFALFFCCLLALIKNFTVFLGHEFDYKTFITGYIGLPVFFISFFGYKFYYKTKFVKPEEADLYTYKAAIDQEEEDGKIQDAEKAERIKQNGKNWEWFYDKYLGKVF
ncbi:similar to Saccharomyces cerevisiae YPL265W DIP5 Dicarboxylic amino acid permease, mediates high-affinity and high-capacity transport of L- glutamate and L-aspartate [Maudiozyma barnettii]|uniref:Similar to Saccharomyces cerevisiae YPL265W DIP5 Dicarboxylic amino acid permease, mediates high-affinity and high-capacity transport of L- glutamate and L-aspartate n=1 Tax=Maudiozyma barnettii TaxID=61262 RepID=A0A8H2VEQ0_9SACH|nr:Dip5p [Kazachstania barnettii]CAB4254172.1 similar to Saccharomyces cerevisiae YPL265W DIP5 Dicarboxylic amino acid permease, mediates high-affinity and high-capacity transport of L- glutamate and L-aspartate [Kazachstania barnettii]CAD1785575.1 similar to Saccharomyces cerevisiae YPL265W DIP5 Dicarboxylic amino acid permease, mediates high-affinity and high-capacity transport of L- glutamate and L-aspartate [Kazachstania barnettii]